MSKFVSALILIVRNGTKTGGNFEEYLKNKESN